MNRYGDAGAFRQALEEKLRQPTASDGGRLRKKVAMERLLVRLQAQQPTRRILKGALALELRLRDRARTTKDIDLGVDLALSSSASPALRPTPNGIAEEFAEAAEPDPGDYFRFVVRGESELEPEVEGVRIFRLLIEALLAGRTFEKFHLDVGCEPFGPTSPEVVNGSALLSFAGLPPERFLVVSRARHLAEKVHALTRPREIPTRVKDLVDILLLEGLGLAREEILAEMKSVFEAWKTHSIPSRAPIPPPEWKSSFEAETARTGLGRMTLEIATERLGRLWKDLGLEES